ncbi:MAG: IS110 family transposase [Sphaerochaetaceae bacterium]|jgi:transposase|nr:IS110 family transposase [Sphaerochaetaceae bacterium]
MTTIVGIDVSSKKANYHILNIGEAQGSSGSFMMNYEGFTSLLSQTNITSDTVFIMESTGVYHLPLQNYLLQDGKKAITVNPVLVKKYAAAQTLRKTKTDKADAFMIASFGEANMKEIESKRVNMSKDTQVKAFARRRQEIAEDIARAKTQLKSDLSIAWPEILKVNVFTHSMLTFLSDYGCAEEVLATSDEELLTAFPRQKGRSTSFSIEKLKELSRNSIGVPHFADLVKDSAKKIITLNSRIGKLTEALVEHEKEFHKAEIEILTSMQGIGDVTASHFMAEIEDITRFNSYQQLIAFIGTDPAIYQSGMAFKNGRITKHGNKNLRKYCYLMAQKSVIYNPVFREYYDKKRGEGFPHRKAMIAVLNKMIKVIFALLTKGETFKRDV